MATNATVVCDRILVPWPDGQARDEFVQNALIVRYVSRVLDTVLQLSMDDDGDADLFVGHGFEMLK